MCVCCAHVCYISVFVVLITAMPANSSSIYMSVILTADSKRKVLVPVSLESRKLYHTYTQ